MADPSDGSFSRSDPRHYQTSDIEASPQVTNDALQDIYPRPRVPNSVTSTTYPMQQAQNAAPPGIYLVTNFPMGTTSAINHKLYGLQYFPGYFPNNIGYAPHATEHGLAANSWNTNIAPQYQETPIYQPRAWNAHYLTVPREFYHSAGHYADSPDEFVAHQTQVDPLSNGDAPDANDARPVHQYVERPSAWVSGNSANKGYSVAGDENFDAITNKIMTENPEVYSGNLRRVFVAEITNPSVGRVDAGSEFYEDSTAEALIVPLLGHPNATEAPSGRFPAPASNQSLPEGRGISSSTGNPRPQSSNQYLSNHRSAGLHPSNPSGTTSVGKKAYVDATHAPSQGPPIPSSRRQPQATNSSLGESSRKPDNVRPSIPTRTSSYVNAASQFTTHSSAVAAPISNSHHQLAPPAHNHGQSSRAQAVQVSDEPYSCCGGLHNGIPVLSFEDDNVFKFFQPVHGPVSLRKIKKPRTSKPKARRKIKREHDEDEVDEAGPSASNKKTKGTKDNETGAYIAPEW